MLFLFVTVHLVCLGVLLAGRDFQIFVIEQSSGAVFNKGALFNIGYKVASEAHFDYMCLHDVDQLPENEANTYAYPPKPIHLCSAAQQFKYKMAYGTMVGGALLLTMDHYRQVNGYSNFYYGWGQEDDDFYERLHRKFGRIERLPRDQVQI